MTHPASLQERVDDAANVRYSWTEYITDEIYAVKEREGPAF